MNKETKILDRIKNILKSKNSELFSKISIYSNLESIEANML